jgi:hypothetical protein
MFAPSKAFHFVLMLAAAFNAVTWASHDTATPTSAPTISAVPSSAPSISAVPSLSALPSAVPSTSVAPSTSSAPSSKPSPIGYSAIVDLGTAEGYVILSKSGISTVPDSSHITGDIAVSPIAATAITGFSLTADSSNVFSTSTQVTGQVKASNYAVPTPAYLTTAVSDMEAAYTDAAGRPTASSANVDFGSGLLGSPTFGDGDNPLTSGVYKFKSDVEVQDDLYFEGDADDVFIIQMTGNLNQVTNTNVVLVGGALAKNIFWQIAGSVVVHVDSHLQGILLVQTDVTFKAGSSLYGRVLSQTACVLQSATMTEPN